MNTLKEILVDAARYRRLRKENITAYRYDQDDKLTETWVMGSEEDLDGFIDEVLASDQ